MIDDLRPDLSFGEGLFGRDRRDWLVIYQTSPADWMYDHHGSLT